MFRPIPEIAFERMKKYLKQHHWTHYFVHSTYCVLRDNLNDPGNYQLYSPQEWRMKF